jgi:hypothetical protein
MNYMSLMTLSSCGGTVPDVLYDLYQGGMVLEEIKRG